MKNFQVSLVKSYTVNIAAEDKEEAKRLAEFYTSNIEDLSTESERQSRKFLIQEIECRMNEAVDCIELENE